MPTPTQLKQLTLRLKSYKSKYMRKQYLELDESATRLMINSFLTDVLGYKELEDIKTEYRIRGEYADYIIQIARKKHFVVEVKAIQIDLTEKHLRQSLNYAANEGIDWIILTNGKQISLYKVLFEKPINYRKIFDFDITNKDDFKKIPDFLVYLTKKCVEKGELTNFRKRFEALEPVQLSKNLYDTEVVKFLRKVLKSKTGFYFQDADILDSINKIITMKISSTMPKTATSVLVKNKKTNKKN